MLRFKLDEKQIDCQLYHDAQIPSVIFGDEQRLSQVLVNLLTNAVKFTPNGGSVVIRTTLINYNPDSGNNNIYFSVKDTGIGISEEHMEKIFIPFSQADNSISRKYGGTGLGLAISKRIIALMGGNLSVKSVIHKGAEFHFVIPLKTGTAAIESDILTAGDALPKFEAIDYTGKTVLLAEDVEINREIIISLLEDTGVTIVIAENGEQAVKAFSADPYGFDLIFMDINMPVLDGFAATRKIRSMDMPRARTIPIIAMTANVFKDDIEKCLAAGMNGHLGKPIDIAQILEKMQRHIKK